MEIPWLISLFLLILTVILALIKLSKSQKNESKKGKLPPGPRKLPVIGNLHQLAAKNRLPHHRLADLARDYGPIMHLTLGELPAIIVSSADVAREVMKTHDAACCSRPVMQLSEQVLYDSTDIAFAPYGEYWRQVLLLNFMLVCLSN